MNDTIEGCRVTGTIKLDGEDIYEKKVDVVPLRARVGMVFQKPNPFPKSIFDNVAYGPRLHGFAADRTQLDEIVHTSLEKAGLLRRSEILFHDRSFVRHAYVVFDHAYGARRKTALEWLEDAGLIPLGRFGRFEYDNSDQCVIKSRALSRRILERAETGV